MAPTCRFPVALVRSRHRISGRVCRSKGGFSDLGTVRSFHPVPCNRAGTHSRCSSLHPPDLCRVRSFRPEPSTPGDIHSMSDDGSHNRSRSPAVAGNTEQWRAALTRVCQARYRATSRWRFAGVGARSADRWLPARIRRRGGQPRNESRNARTTWTRRHSGRACTGGGHGPVKNPHRASHD
jgi:hypothetical protein